MLGGNKFHLRQKIDARFTQSVFPTYTPSEKWIELHFAPETPFDEQKVGHSALCAEC